jgi:hypothetical protein
MAVLEAKFAIKKKTNSNEKYAAIRAGALER